MFFVSLCALIAVPWHVSAESSIIAHYSGVVQPYQTAYQSHFGFNLPQFLVATGTLSHLVLPLASVFDSDGSAVVGMRLQSTASNSFLDCQTPFKTMDAWGITRVSGDPNASMVDFGPFTGSECAIPPSNASHDNAISAYLFDESGSGPSDWIAVMGNEGYFNFTAYADATPTLARASSVLFLPGMEGSRLYMREPDGGERQLWEPSFHTDIPLLAMNANGTSVNRVYTKDIIDTMYGNDAVLEGPLARLFMHDDLEVYGQFGQFMRRLVSTNIIKEWRAYPYDWRYDPFDIVTKGTLVEMPGGDVATVYLQDVLQQLASSSPTGKVTIVAHSNGGLVAKALALTLGADAPNYIDRIILVGTPQYGTPKAIGAMLHGDGESLGLGLIMSSVDVRSTTQSIPDAYDLLPSSDYLTYIQDPVATFDTQGILSGRYASTYGEAVHDKNVLDMFLTNSAGLDALVGGQDDTDTPLILSHSLLSKANELHARLDNWTPPSGIAVTSIAGWGQDTIKNIAYTDGDIPKLSCTRLGHFSLAACQLLPSLVHSSSWTSDGDGTVIDRSAIGNTSDFHYFNTKDFFKDTKNNIRHLNLMSGTPIESGIKDLLENSGLNNETYLWSTRPSNGSNPITIIEVVSDAPVTATDELGNESGVVSVPGKDFALPKEGAAGASVHVSGSKKQVTTKSSGKIKVTVGKTASSAGSSASKTKSGTAKIKVEKTQPGGTASTTAAYEIPMTASTTVTILVDNGTAGVPVVDLGDGTPPYTIGSETPATVLPPPGAIGQLKELFEALAVRPGVKNRLLRALQPIEASAGDLAAVQSSIANLETLLRAQTGVKLSLDQGASMLQLLDTLKL